MTTIAKNRKAKIEDIFARAARCTVYTLGNEFRGCECEPSRAKEDLMDSRNARLSDNGNGKFVVHVHSNLWYEITA
jgi:hypothetical protein